MYISRVIIRNVKGFDRLDLDLRRPGGGCAGWTAIAGRNGSGKTTFLRAIALAAAGPRVAARLVESFSGWAREGSTSASVEIEVLPTAEDALKESGQSTGLRCGLEWRRDRSRNGDTGSTRREPRIECHPGTDAASQARLEESIWSPNPEGWFLCGYGPFRRLSGHASDASRLMSMPHQTGRLVNLFREDASLVESVAWLKEVHGRSLEERAGARELKQSLLTLLDDGLLPAGMQVERLDSDGLWVRQADACLLLEDLSDGYRNLAGLVLDICRHLYACYGSLPVSHEAGHCSVTLPGVVLIDEMEAHLHISWQQHVGTWLKSRFPALQLIVATHSPFICQAADPNGLIRFPGPGDSGSAVHVDERTYFTVVNGGADDAILTELFGLDRPHSPSAERLKQQVAKLEARDVRGDLTAAEANQLVQLSRRLPTSPNAMLEQSNRFSRIAH